MAFRYVAITGLDAWKRSLQRSAVYVAREGRTLLEKYGQKVVNKVVADGKVKFDRQSLFYEIETQTQNHIVMVMGWQGVAAGYGYVWERGPAIKDEWDISPRNLKKDGTPIKALRIVSKGEVAYRRHVHVIWGKGKMREKPHFQPAADELYPWLESQWKQIIDESFQVA